MPRRTTLSARLARMGFADPAEAGLLAALAAAADPDLALAALARMPRDAELLTALHQDADLARRLALVLGASAALGDHLARHPEGWRLLRGPGPLACPSAGELRSARIPLPPSRWRWPGRRPGRTPARPARCGWRTVSGCCTWRPGTSPASWRSTTWPPS